MAWIRSLPVIAALASTVASPVRADIHLIRRANGSAMIFNDIGSGWRVNGKAPSDSYLLARRGQPSPYDELIRTTASQHGVDPALVKSVMLVESNFNPRALSRKGARGLMQLMPGTALRYGVPVSNMFEPAQNIQGGVKYLSDLLGLYSGNAALALAAYNAGEGAVAKHLGIPPYPETQEYVRRAMIVYTGKGAVIMPSTLPAQLGGGFKGATAARVTLDRQTRLLANEPLGPRSAPLLGRVTAP